MARTKPSTIRAHARWVVHFLEAFSSRLTAREQRIKLHELYKWCRERGLIDKTELRDEEFHFVRWDKVLAICEEFDTNDEERGYRIEFIGFVEGLAAAMSLFDPRLKQNRKKWRYAQPEQPGVGGLT